MFWTDGEGGGAEFPEETSLADAIRVIMEKVQDQVEHDLDNYGDVGVYYFDILTHEDEPIVFVVRING